MAGVSMIDITITCQDGLKLAGQRYSSTTNTTTTTNDDNDTKNTTHYCIFCCHGWMDNCRSFHKLGPGLVKGIVSKMEGIDDDDDDGTTATTTTATADVVALDFPGHGRSDHKSLDGPSMLLMDYVYYLYDALQQLGWGNLKEGTQSNDDNDGTKKTSTTTTTKTTTASTSTKLVLIGHSMGGALTLMLAAAFPEMVDKVIMLDSLGPWPKSPSEVTKNLRRHVRSRMLGKQPNSVYPNINVAIEARCMTARSFPGKQYISKEAATELVLRASKPLQEAGGEETKTKDEENGGGTDDATSPLLPKIQFLHDQRLKWTSILFLSQEHLERLYADVAMSSPSVETCILLGKDGMPFGPDRIGTIQSLLKPKVLQTLPGSHHFHMDPETSEAVCTAIVNFLL